MLTAEIKINGSLIGVLYVHNMGYTGSMSQAELCKYETVYHEIAARGLPRSAGFAGFKHDRADGARVCIIKALEALGE